MKTCSVCNKSKNIIEFNKKKKYYQSLCKDCQKEYHKKWYCKNKKSVKKRLTKNKIRYKKEIIEYLIDILTKSKCELCSNDDFYCLEFDHIKNKKNNISTLVSNYSLNTIKKEISNCRVLCANCHRKVTHVAVNSWRHQHVIGLKGIEPLLVDSNSTVLPLH